MSLRFLLVFRSSPNFQYYKIIFRNSFLISNLAPRFNLNFLRRFRINTKSGSRSYLKNKSTGVEHSNIQSQPFFVQIRTKCSNHKIHMLLSIYQYGQVEFLGPPVRPCRPTSVSKTPHPIVYNNILYVKTLVKITLTMSVLSSWFTQQKNNFPSRLIF